MLERGTSEPLGSFSDTTEPPKLPNDPPINTEWLPVTILYTQCNLTLQLPHNFLANYNTFTVILKIALY